MNNVMANIQMGWEINMGETTKEGEGTKWIKDEKERK
jgi:hypothetical protein